METKMVRKALDELMAVYEDKKDNVSGYFTEEQMELILDTIADNLMEKASFHETYGTKFHTDSGSTIKYHDFDYFIHEIFSQPMQDSCFSGEGYDSTLSISRVLSLGNDGHFHLMDLVNTKVNGLQAFYQSELPLSREYTPDFDTIMEYGFAPYLS